MPTHGPGMNRREFLRAAGAVGTAGIAAAMTPGGLFAAAASAGPKRPPNVILIFTDDQGSIDVNCYGAKDLHTPNLDDLARRGTRFTQFYVGAPVCSPSRAALLTGRCPQRAGVPSNVGQDNGLPNEQVTIAETLKAVGYRTAIFGKWHLGHRKELSPLAQGFDEFFGHKNGCIDNYSHFFYWAGPNRHDLWRNNREVWEEGRFFPDLVVREAKRFLKANRDRPFFLYLPFNVPHYPLQGTAKWRKRYAKLEPPRRMYAAFVSTLDEKIGEVMATVDELGLRENTLVIFLSDHGHSEEIRTFGGGGSAGPYRGHKFQLWEGGIRVPCIASLPGTIAAGAVRRQMACSVDWLPTIAALCGAKPPVGKLDGRDLTAVLRSPDAPSPHKVFHWQSGNMWAVREGKWKLVATRPRSRRGATPPAKPNVSLFLADLEADVGEKTNLAARHPDVVRRLRKLHEDWLKDVKRP
jgi:arylsulfatase A